MLRSLPTTLINPLQSLLQSFFFLFSPLWTHWADLLSFLHSNSLFLAFAPSAYILHIHLYFLFFWLFELLLCFKPSDATHPILILNDVSPNRCQCGPFAVVSGPDGTPFVGFKFTYCIRKRETIKSPLSRKHTVSLWQYNSTINVNNQ